MTNYTENERRHGHATIFKAWDILRIFRKGDLGFLNLVV